MKVTCIGDCGEDFYVDQNQGRPGGCALNFAIHWKRLQPTSDIKVISSVGNDLAGEQIQQVLLSENVQYRFHSHHQLPTARCHIRVTEKGDRQFVDYEPGALGSFSLDSDDLGRIRTSDLLMAVQYQRFEPHLLSIIQNKALAKWNAADFSELAEYEYQLEPVLPRLGHLDIAFFSLCQRNNKEGGFLRTLLSTSTQIKALLIATEGAAGVHAISNGSHYFVPAQKISRAVDATGAGDSFIAAFLKTYMQDPKNLNHCLKMGAAYAAQTVQNWGAY